MSAVRPFAEFLGTVGYDDGSGLLQQCGRASELQNSGFGRSAADNLGMAMGLNNYGWTLNMEQLLDHFTISLSARLVQGTVSITIGNTTFNSARWAERTVRSIGTELTTPGNLSVCPKDQFQIQMVKTFAFWHARYL